jgi:hypothetical protein
MAARPKWREGILFNNQSHSDIIIRCGNQSIFAHKSILMTKSGLFYTAFSSDFPIARASIYDIDGHAPEVVEYMIRLIYDAYRPGLLQTVSAASSQDLALQLFTIANEYQVERLGRAVTHTLIGVCDGHVKGPITEGDHLSELRFTLQQIAALYQDNVIADRFLIDRVGEFVKTEPCRMLIRSVPEVLEILYVQRTTRVDFRPSAVTSTFFRPVTMDEYYRRDHDGGVSASRFTRRTTQPRVPPPSRSFKDRPTKRGQADQTSLTGFSTGSVISLVRKYYDRHQKYIILLLRGLDVKEKMMQYIVAAAPDFITE